MAYAPQRAFQWCVVRYSCRERIRRFCRERIRRFTYWDQFLALAFAQLTCSGSPRDIEV
jgi:hypothetical protein